MAQEPGLFSVRRTRETLGERSHNASAIPMPSSAMKRSNSISNLQQPPPTGTHMRSTSGSRMSLAPGRPAQPMFARSSSGNNLADVGFLTVQRPSTQNVFGSTGGRKSYAPVSATPASALQFQDSAQRRSSVYSARPSTGLGPSVKQSFFATAPPQNGIPIDPRQLKNPGVRAQMGNELMEYLTTHNFEMEMKHSLTHKTMTSPTQKDFNLMFQFLYHCIDPSYRFQKNIDAEVPPLLKQLRYPFEKNISKSQLAAVGGNNWSTFLGLLHWMMQLAKMMEQYALGTYDDACIEAGIDVSGDRIQFQFLSDAYKEWLSVEDDDEANERIRPHIDAMAARFAAANGQNLEQVKMLEAESRSLQDQIDALSKSAPKLAKLDEQNKILGEDRVKFENYNKSMEAKVEKYTTRARLLEEEIAKVEQELAEAEEERRALQDSVDRQGITIQDIDRMNTERERLQKGVETTSMRLEESKQRVASKEADTALKLEDLEIAVAEFNRLGYQIGMIPSSAPNAQGQDYELRLTVHEGPNFGASQTGASQQISESDRLLADQDNGYKPHHVLNLDLRGGLKSNILALRHEISERRNTALEQDQNNHDMLEKVKEAIDEKRAEIESLEHRIRTADDELERTRDITNTQKSHSDAQIEKMEKELAKMRAGLGESVQLMEQREMNTSLEYEQLQEQANALREELHTELERILNEIIKFKLHIQAGLEGYEEFVAQEVERECEEQEAADVADAVGKGEVEDDDTRMNED
ncbi:kinetochore-associated Ndc80 complex subunit ndc80 [Elasticomyces elasticus]|nr:kinetochore-associated Ndc80 complex subunit ndc80 [Elasticomyces elasticus]